MKLIAILGLLLLTTMLLTACGEELTPEDRCTRAAKLDYNVEDVYCYNPRYDETFCECFKLACGQVSCKEIEDSKFDFFMRYGADRT